MLATLLAHLRNQWMGALALFLFLASGTAYAANTVFRSDIVDGSSEATRSVRAPGWSGPWRPRRRPSGS